MGIASARAFVIERYGEAGWSATLSRLTPSDRVAVNTSKSFGWVPLALYARLLRAVDEAHGAGDLALLVRLGRFAAERDVRDVTAFDDWNRFHDTGRWEMSRMSDTQIVATLHGWGHADYALCRELVGYIGRVLEVVESARDVIVEHPRCRGRGDQECAFQARWRPARVPLESVIRPARRPDAAFDIPVRLTRHAANL